MVGPREWPVEGLDDPHATAATRARRRVAVGRTMLVVIVAGEFHRSRRHLKELSTQREFLGTVAVCKQAIMANAMEAIREHVEQEPAHELARVEPHELVFVMSVLAVILPAKADVMIANFLEATVGDGDAVGVAGK